MAIGDRLDRFLGERFVKGLVETLKTVHHNEEGRPIETVWDAAVSVTAYARNFKHQNQRVDMERQAGKLLTG